MLTLISIPKPFQGHVKIIQTNALKSWLSLCSSYEVILFGDEQGTAEVAAKFGVSHVPEVLKNEHGTPLLSDVLQKAQTIASHHLLCYLNADIILMSDFTNAVEQIRRLRKRFLVAGRRWDIDLDRLLDFEQVNWEEQLVTYVQKRGRPTPSNWIDYFVFPSGLYRDVPPFAIGRPAFDNWLLWKARSLRVPLIDASDVILAVHQTHDYSHHPHGQRGVWEGLEAQENRRLMGGWHHCFTLSDATHKLTPLGLKPNLGPSRFIRTLGNRPWQRLMAWTRPLRQRWGLARSNLKVETRCE